ncbi:MAG: DUF6056 family protein [Gammaproteobacteria bacterium]|nr:DUF6056 family protein [Gammaproteobacteria bacterium]
MTSKFRLGSKNYIIAFFCLLFIYLLCINFFTPLWADDYGRSLALSGFSELFHAVAQTYFDWSGRITVMFFTYLFLWKNTAALLIFNFVNSLVFIAFIYFIFLNACARKPSGKYDLVLLFVIFNLVWFLPTAIGEVAFWKTGAIGYLWVLTASLALVYPFTRLTLENIDIIPHKITVRVLLLIASLLLGACLENVSAAMCFYFVCSIIFLQVKKRKIPAWVYYVTFGYIAGTVLLIIAPGNFHRIAVITHHYTILYQFAYLLFRIVVRLIPFGIVFLLIFFMLKKTGYRLQFLQWKRFFTFAGLSLLTAFAMMGIPHAVWFDGRNAFATDIFAIVALMSLLPTNYEKIYNKFILPVVFFILLPLCLLDMTNVWFFYHTKFSENKMREIIIAKNLIAHNKKVALPSYKNTAFFIPKISAYRLFSRDITADQNYWVNQAVAKYYNLEAIWLESNKK